ncbi:MAG: DUF1501 domain-containing protein [Candidatus Dormibacteraeota bacterium]|nr:DUF1501 domain-containing protein [Candidatus Dormibacteraeota bacterium]MBV9525054.1 DUF1501 domain-containing protein [Candidatus Dormibacteraeota bacterium]
MITRRDFLVSGLTATAAGVIVPPVLAKSVFAATADGIHNDRVLVVVQLAGGNDGLNTVVPYADPAYMDARPTLRVQPGTVLALDSHTGLNPALTGLKRLYDAGEVAVVQGVGYDNPSYSHFESMYVWEHADPARRQTDGWLGTLLAKQLDTQGHPLTACALGDVSTPPEMLASKAEVSVIQSVAAYQVQGGASRESAAPALYRSTPGAYGALFDSALSTAETGIAALHAPGVAYSPAVPYTPSSAASPLATSLQLTAEMIVTQPSVKVCHVLLSGFDTHQDEVRRQTALLQQVDAALSAFMQDMAAHGQADRVVLMTWSEFGRRIHENGSQGTDHGAAAPLFILGKPVKGGLYGETPSLTDTIDSGNLKHSVDFRSVYQAVVGDWLQGDAASVLGGAFPALPLFR